MLTSEQESIVNQATEILFSLFEREDTTELQPEYTMKFCQLQIGNEKNEVFGVLFLDNSHRLIKFEKMFFGTINGASVHTRPVAQRALELNAAACIFTHNHPSGNCSPSDSDIRITNTLSSALEIFDVSVIDHIVVSQLDAVSFANEGLL